MPITSAFLRLLGRVGLTRYIPSFKVPFFAPSEARWLSHSPCHSLIHSSPSTPAGMVRGGLAQTGYAVCHPAADVPAGAPLSAEVSNKEVRSVQELQDML